MRDRGPRNRQQSIPDKHAINEAITASEVRVISSSGEQLGIMAIQDAIGRAEQEGLDLVEVAPNAEPPVCRILDYGKLKYQEQKKASETRKKAATHTVKELRVRYSTDSHDMDTKLRKAREFIEQGDRVKFQMRFRGREVVYRDLGEQIFDNIAESLEDIAVVDDRSPLMGNRMNMTLAPKNLTKT